MLYKLLLTVAASLYVFAGSGSAKTTSPAVVLVPGAFHSSQTYHKVVRILRDSGYKYLFPITLHSVGSLAGRQADVDATGSVVSQQLNAGRDVILVGNSYGGTVISEVAKGFKATNNNHGKVLGLIYLSGYIPYITEVTHPGSRGDIKALAPTFFRFVGDEKVYWDNDLANFPPQETFYNQLPAWEADLWSRRLNYSSFRSVNATATYIPYTGGFKCVYVVQLADTTVPPAFAYSYINQTGAQFIVETIDADHISPLSQPVKVVDIIRKYATMWHG